MGATNFQTMAVGSTPTEAYENAIRSAEREYGSNSYNGTISTTEGFDIRDLNDEERIGEWLAEAWDSTEKWGRCWCTEVPKNGAPDGRVWLFAGWAAE